MSVKENVYNILIRKSSGACADEDKGKLKWGVGIDQFVWA
jgi:hypothetical protein